MTFFLVSNWDLHRHRNLNDDEIDELSSLLTILNPFHPNPSQKDPKVWALSFQAPSRFLLFLGPFAPILFLLSAFFHLAANSLFEGPRLSLEGSLG